MNRRAFLTSIAVGLSVASSGCVWLIEDQKGVVISEAVEADSTFTVEVEAGDDIEIRLRTNDGSMTEVRVTDPDDQQVIQEFVGSGEVTLKMTVAMAGEYRIHVLPEGPTDLRVRIR